MFYKANEAHGKHQHTRGACVHEEAALVARVTMNIMTENNTEKQMHLEKHIKFTDQIIEHQVT